LGNNQRTPSSSTLPDKELSLHQDVDVVINPLLEIYHDNDSEEFNTCMKENGFSFFSQEL